MRISRAAEYGLIAVGYITLQQNELELPAKVILEKFNIPVSYLYKTLTDLTNARILSSKRGPTGGYVLAREPEKISLLEIIKVIEGPTFESGDFIENIANESLLVRMKELSGKVNSELQKMLSETTLADIIKE